MDEYNYYHRLTQAQRSIEDRAAHWQAQLRWAADVGNALSVRAQTHPKNQAGSQASATLQDRLASRRDGQHTLDTVPVHASLPHAHP
jgi:hypothetical protein